MDIVRGATRVVTRTADATTAAAGAVGGAAVNGVIGGVQGTVSGLRKGLSSGSHSTPAAALTLGVLGAAGLVDWPVLLVVGGTALVVHQLSGHTEEQRAVTAPTPLKVAGSQPRKSAPRASSASSRPRKATTRRRRTTAKS